MSDALNQAAEQHTIWECDYCSQAYQTKEASLQCEALCSQKMSKRSNNTSIEVASPPPPPPPPPQPVSQQRQAPSDFTIMLDKIRPLASHQQLISEPVSGLHISGMSDGLDNDFLMEDFDLTNDPVIAKQKSPPRPPQATPQPPSVTTTRKNAVDHGQKEREEDGSKTGKESLSPNESNQGGKKDEIDSTNKKDSNQGEDKPHVTDSAENKSTREASTESQPLPRPIENEPMEIEATKSGATDKENNVPGASLPSPSPALNVATNHDDLMMDISSDDEAPPPPPPLSSSPPVAKAQNGSTTVQSTEKPTNMNNDKDPMVVEEMQIAPAGGETRKSASDKNVEDPTPSSHTVDSSNKTTQSATALSLANQEDHSAQDPAVDPSQTKSTVEDNSWDEKFAAIKTFKKAHGHLQIDDPDLHDWFVSTVLALGRRQEETNLSTEEAQQIAKFDQLGVTWPLVERETFNQGQHDTSTVMEPENDQESVSGSDESRNNGHGVVEVGSVEAQNDADHGVSDEASSTEVDMHLQEIEDDLALIDISEYLNHIDRDITAAEEKAKKRPRFALEDHDNFWETDMQPCRRTPKKKKRRVKYTEVEVLPNISKLVPKSIDGRPFIVQDDLQSLLGLLENDCYTADLEPITGDANSWRLFVYTTKEQDEKSIRKHLEEWLLRMRTMFNGSLLREKGVECSFEIDANARLGCRVRCCEDRDKNTVMMLTASTSTSGGVCPLPELWSVLERGGVLLTKVDGEPCLSVKDFKDRKSACEKQGRPFHIKGLKASSPPPTTVKTTQMPRASSSVDTPQTFSSTGDHKRSAENDQDFPGTSLNASKSFHYFENKYKAVGEIEYKTSGIKIKSVSGSMWKQHKKRFGTECHNGCKCALDLPFLTQNVIEDNLSKEKWSNPLSLKASDSPVGFSKYFCKNFQSYLQAEYPRESPTEIFKRLVQMWKKHESTLIYGITCSETCECVQGWETVFKKGMSKSEEAAAQAAQRTSAEMNRIDRPQQFSAARATSVENHPIVQRQGHERRQFSFSGSAQHDPSESKPFQVIFKANLPMGQYYVDNVDKDGTSRAVVQSVCMKATLKATNDEGRIQKGTTVVAVLDDYLGRIAITGWRGLKKYYEKAKKDGKDLKVEFINREAPELFWKALSTDEWTSSFKWKGKLTNGWAGGAFYVSATAQVSTQREKQPTQTSNQPTQTSNQPVVAESEISPRNEIVTNGWRRMNIKRPLLGERPTSILSNTTNANQRPRRNLTWNEQHMIAERVFEKSSLSTEFLVPNQQPLQRGSKQESKKKEDLYRALDSGTFIDVLKLLENGAASNIPPEELSLMHQSLSEKKEEYDGMRKDKLLKIYLTALTTSKNAEALSCWCDFTTTVEKLEVKLADELKETTEILVLSLKTKGRTFGKSEPHLEKLHDLPFENKEVVSFSDKSVTIRYNPLIDPQRILEVEVKRQTGNESLGLNHLNLSRLAKSAKNKIQRFSLQPVNPMMQSGHVTIRFERYQDDKKVKERRRELCLKMKETLDWISRFNDDLTDREKGQGRLSYEVPIGGATMLHTAVALAEKHLVQDILKRGASVTKSIWELTRRQDGFSRQDVVHVLKDHEKELAKAAQDESSAALIGRDIVAVGQDWLFQLEQGRRYKKECPNFIHGRCQYGKTCPNGHVYRAGQNPTVPAVFNKNHAHVICRQNHHKIRWYTSGYLDGNEFYLPFMGEGVLCEQTGVYWFKTEERAQNAARAAVEGYRIDSL